MKDVYLNQFEIIKPPFMVQQNNLTEWIARCHTAAAEVVGPNDLPILKLFQRYAVKEPQIATRYFENEDVLGNDFSNMQIFKINKDQPHGENILTRTQFFSEKALNVFHRFYENVKYKPDHLIHVTCTGYISPSAPQRIVAEVGWQKPTAITHAYHMGCYAALPAVRLAQSLVASESINNSSFSADIVHTEICGLHLNPLAHTPEQMVVQTLFADGHIKYSATAEKKTNARNFKIISTHERVLPDSAQDMSWVPSPWGMQMNLSREVPAKIKSHLKVFFQELLNKSEMNLAEALASQFAIHPGGPKIIDSVQETLELKDDQTKHSRTILRQRGNMSSATLPHVWELMLNDENIAIGSRVISFAFGPGLTMFGCVLEVC